MTATIPNIAKGRMNQFVNNVNDNDPSTSGFVVFLLQDTGLDTLAVLRDFDAMDTLLAANTECSVSAYARLVLDDGDVGAPTVDDSGDAQTFDVADFDFGALEAGETISASVIAYAPDTAGATSTMIPVHVSIPTTPVDTNGETFHWRTPNGLWSAEEAA
jgi:hypothetical protein